MPVMTDSVPGSFAWTSWFSYDGKVYATVERARRFDRIPGRFSFGCIQPVAVSGRAAPPFKTPPTAGFDYSDQSRVRQSFHDCLSEGVCSTSVRLAMSICAIFICSENNAPRTSQRGNIVESRPTVCDSNRFGEMVQPSLCGLPVRSTDAEYTRR